MAKILTPYIQDMLDSKDLKIRFVLKINSTDYSAYLLTWSISNSADFGAAQATFTLVNNNDGMFGYAGSDSLSVGDVVEFSEYFGDDPTEFKKFYGIINQRSIVKNPNDRAITIVCLDYIATLQVKDINLECEGVKIKVVDEFLKPNYLPAPNDTLAQVFDFANNSIADNPRPIVMIKNKGTAEEDPQYDGFEIMYDEGQLKLGFPLNAQDNYDVYATSYYFYVKGIYAEDVLETILTQQDAYGNYLFNATSPQDLIDNNLTDNYLSVTGHIGDYLIPNYTTSNINIETTLSADNAVGATSINVVSTAGFPNSGEGTVNGDIFTWTSKTATTLEGIPDTGPYSLSAHATGSYIIYEGEYAPGTVWYLTYNNLVSDLTIVDFTFVGQSPTIDYLDKRFGRIILNAAIPTTTIVTCDVNYIFRTLQASGILLNRISFKSRELSNAYDAVGKLRKYLAPNYVIRTRGDNKIWSSYLSQKVIEDYTLQVATGITYLEDEDLSTRTIFYGKNKNPRNIMFSDAVTFVGTGLPYKAIASAQELMLLRDEGGYYVYGSPLSEVGKITTNSLKPVVYINDIPLDNKPHLIDMQEVTLETTTRSETTVEGGGK